MEIKLYLRMLSRGWWIIVVTMLVAINVALVTAYFTRPMYRAVARFSVSPSASLAGSGQQVLNSMEALDKRSIVQTYAEFLNSQRIYQETLLTTRLTPTEMLEYTRSAVVTPDANVLELTVEGPDPEIVADLANRIGQNAIAYIKQLYIVYDINTLDPAFVPVIPVKPQPLRDAGVAGLLGLVVGAGIAIMSEQIRIPLEAYRQRASSDPVSMVYNRRFVQIRLDDFISRNPAGKIAVGLVRLNELRDIIDTLPSNVVQNLLREVASILRQELRGNDLIGRWNNITFIIVLPSTGEMPASRTLERIRNALLQPITLKNYGETISLDPMVSVASYQEGETTSELTSRAEYSLERVQVHETAAASAD